MGCNIWKLCETITLSSSTLIFSDVFSVRSLSRLHLCSTLTLRCPCSLLVGSHSYKCAFPRAGAIPTGFLPSKGMPSTKQARRKATGKLASIEKAGTCTSAAASHPQESRAVTPGLGLSRAVSCPLPATTNAMTFALQFICYLQGTSHCPEHDVQLSEK